MEYIPFLRFDAAQYGNQVVLSVAAVMFLCGIVALLYGWKLYRLLVIAATALAGAYLGWYLADGYQMLPDRYRFLGPLVLGLLGAFAAIPLQKAAIFFIGASAGFVSLGPVVAGMIWKTPPGPTVTQSMVTGMLCFVAMGIVSLLLFRAMVMVATSMLGATLVVSGGVQIAEALWRPSNTIFAVYQVQLAAVFVALTVAGVVFQSATHGKKKKEK